MLPRAPLYLLCLVLCQGPLSLGLDESFRGRGVRIFTPPTLPSHPHPGIGLKGRLALGCSSIIKACCELSLFLNFHSYYLLDTVFYCITFRCQPIFLPKNIFKSGISLHVQMMVAGLCSPVLEGPSSGSRRVNMCYAS